MAVFLLVISSCATVAAQSEAVFRFAILGDRTGGHVPGVFPRVVDEIKLVNPDIVLTVGDHIEGYQDDMAPARAEWDSLLPHLDRLGAPIYMTPGNHDIWSDESEELYREKTGRPPYYSFDHRNTHFVILDNSRIESWSDISEAQRLWLVADLEGSRDAENVFIFFHKPLWAFTLGRGEPDPLHEIFLAYGVDAVFSGHFHEYFSANYDGIEYTAIGSSGGAITRVEQQPVARGEFFQFGWVTVSSPGYELATIQLGNVYPRNVATMETRQEIERIERELISASPVPVVDGRATTVMTVTITNAAERTIGDELTWKVTDGWQVNPEVVPLKIRPGETADLEFQLTCAGPLYPAPRFSVPYPLESGRYVDADVPARVVRRVSAHRFDRRPTIDGSHDERCWAEAERVADLYPPYEDAVVEGETRFLFGYDDANVYLAAVCHEPSMDEMAADVEERDGPVWQEDCVGFFLHPDPDQMVVYQIYFNPKGAAFDQKISFDENMIYDADRSWNGEYEVGTRKAADHWTFEARIPLEEMGVGVDRPWGLNFRRKQARTSAAADWQVPISYDPRSFGELHFD